MARLASGGAYVAAAHKLLSEAKTADELRQAQSVLLPLEEGLSLEQTAGVIGRSVRRTCAMRRRFIQIAAGERDTPRKKNELRNRAHNTLEEESRVLDEVLASANVGGVVSVPQMLPLLASLLGRAMPLPTVYKHLARHGWRKLAPDTQHPQGDWARREQWKKNFPTN